MRFDWRRLCDEHGVEYIESGPDVARNNIYTKCPFCDDWEHHMGMSLDDRHPSWGCWRCKAGSSRSVIALLCKLLRVGRPRAEEIARSHETASPDDFDGLFDEPFAAPKRALQPVKVLPRGLRRMDSGVRGAEGFLDYLKTERGFPDPEGVARMYDLHYALVGDYKGRVVLPVYMEQRLVSWVGRAIGPTLVRYKTEDNSDLKKTLANWDNLLCADPSALLLIGEGYFDFMKLDYFGLLSNIRGTCTFGTAYTQEQVALLVRLVRKFRKTLVVFDQGALVFGGKLADELSELSGKEVGATYVVGHKDPGEMAPEAIYQFRGI